MSRNGKLCDGLSGDKLEDRCGRPLGLKFNTKTGDLYIADAYYGLMVVGGGGGVAETVSGGSKETSFFFANGVDVDEETGLVYFTRTSTQFKRRYLVYTLVNYFLFYCPGYSDNFSRRGP